MHNTMLGSENLPTTSLLHSLIISVINQLGNGISAKHVIKLA